MVPEGLFGRNVDQQTTELFTYYGLTYCLTAGNHKGRRKEWNERLLASDGEAIHYLSAVLTDFEIPVGTLLELLSERCREIRRLNEEVEQALCERKVI